MAYINGKEILFSANVTSRPKLFAPNVFVWGNGSTKIKKREENGAFATSCGVKYHYADGVMKEKTYTGAEGQFDFAPSKYPAYITEIYVDGENFQRGTLAVDIYFKDANKHQIQEKEYYASNITEYVIPSNITDIYARAFQQCASLKKVRMCLGCATIGDCAFDWCTSLTEFDIPNCVKTIGTGAFTRVALPSVTIPSSVTSFGWSAFRYCESLKTVTYESSATIKNLSFADCPSLETFYFKATPEAIEPEVFTNSPNLKDIYVPWSEGKVADAPWGAENATIHYNSEV